ncbi:MAG: sulfatase-like hydrolase/transferase [Candidatus Lokiarchaeota archaeon]|nr:sulfatase-like hydrolase/transferase [Candidatus Lokiarchaeota archaeon]MBD3199810.1 sulfatase-like hydrolase/transferase [Candidatus Lokiarchaeota archaeon]
MSKKLNVLFIMTDQHRADHMGCTGNSIIKTPNLDKLASDGIRFSNAFCTSPMCMPNRATLLTGYFPNVHGVRSNGINLSDDVPTITDTLTKKGWHTAAFGKLHLQFWSPPYKRRYKSAECWGDWMATELANNPVRENFPIPYYGFKEVEMISGHGIYCTGHYMQWLEERYPEYMKTLKKRFKKVDNFFLLYDKSDLPEELYSTTYVKNRTIAYLERHARGDYGEKPFFIHCSFPDPHHPICPPGKYEQMYKSEDIDLPESFSDLSNLYDHPFLGNYLRNPLFRGAMIRESTEEEVRKFISLTYGSMTMIDHAIGEILASLEKLGHANNTIVIYTSDHGDLMGDHGLLLKGPSPFKGVLKVPLIWKIPEQKRNLVSDSLISSIDIPKTILELLHINPRHHPPKMQGIDFSPVFRDPLKKLRNSCLIMEDEELGPNGPLIIKLRHLITETYKLTIYDDINDYGDLYNRKDDPYELNNLYDSSNHQGVRNDLLDKMIHALLNSEGRFPERIAGV